MRSINSIAGSLWRNKAYLCPFSNKIGYIGWLGFDNLGDEALYLMYQKMFSPDKVLPWKYTDKIKKYEEIIRRRFFSAVQLGGGTLINVGGAPLEAFRLAQDLDIPTFVFGAGVKNPEFWTEKVGDKCYLSEWVPLLEHSFFVGVRGPLSKKILEKEGFQSAQIVGDPVLSFGRKKIFRKLRNKRVVINFGITGNKQWSDDITVKDFIIKLSNAMFERGWEVIYLPVWGKDVAFVEKAARVNPKAKVFYEYRNIDRVLELFESADLCIGEKLHSVVFAMCAHTPSIMLEYRPKCLDFMMSMGMQDFNVRTDRLSLDHVLHLVDRLWSDLPGYQDKIAERVSEYKKLQKETAIQIKERIHRQ